MFTVNAKTGNGQVFVDGKLSSVIHDFHPDFSTANRSDLYLAVENGQGSCLPFWYPLDGVIDELRIYSRELAASEVAALFRQGTGGAATDVPPTPDWRAILKSECHLSLAGITFDFNKATIPPESEPTLAKAAETLLAEPTMTVEVQGYTDDVGSDDYNMKLSQSRAEAVLAWMADHGVAKTRLRAKGFGRSVPLVPNDSEQNRAKNRRVELLNLGCAAVKQPPA